MLISKNYLRCNRAGQSKNGKNYGCFMIGKDTFATVYTDVNKVFEANKMYRFSFSLLGGNCKDEKMFVNCYINTKKGDEIEERIMNETEKEKYKKNKEKTQNKDTGEYEDTLPF